MKVNTIGIGAGRSGTTWLYGLMRAHPLICASQVKETLFFETEYHRGTRWYHKQFMPRGDQTIIGEVSNTYIFEPKVAQRMARYNPGLKIVATVRNPIERAHSHYLFLLRNGTHLPPFEQALEEHPHLLWRGLYYRHLMAYADHFPSDQIKVLVFDDLRQDSRAYGAAFLEFLGLDSHLPDIDERQYRLPTSQARSRLFARSLKMGAKVARAAGMPSLVQRVRESPLQRLAFREVSAKHADTLSADLKSRLADHFRDDTQKLSRWLGRDLEREWFGPKTDAAADSSFNNK